MLKYENAIIFCLHLLGRAYSKDTINFRNETDVLLPRNNDYTRFGEVMDIDNERLIIGNYVKDEAFIFTKKDREWKQEATLTATNRVRSYFGRSVGISGNYSVVGAVHESYGKQRFSGAAYIFEFVNSTWTRQVRVIPSDPGWYHYFGYSVAISDDYVVVGCPYHERKAGIVYIFKKQNGAWRQNARLQPADSADFNIFGHSVAIDGNHVVVSTLHNNGDKDVLSGAAYVFKYTGHAWIEEIKLRPRRKIRDYNDDEFAYSIAINGNYIIVGCPGDDENGLSSGAIYIYEKETNNQTWEENFKLQPSDGVANDYFGSAVDITKDYMVVGSRRGHQSSKQPGTAYIFQRFGHEWKLRSKLSSSDQENDANFGFTVVVNGKQTIVGCPWCKRNKNGWGHRGSAYIFNI